MLFDTHAHLDDQAFDQDRRELIARLPQAGIGLSSPGRGCGAIPTTRTFPRKIPGCGSWTAASWRF